MGTLTDSEDSDEMQQNAAFHQDLHCLLRLKQPSMTENNIIIKKILHVIPKITQWTVPYLLYQYVWENPSEYKGSQNRKKNKLIYAMHF